MSAEPESDQSKVQNLKFQIYELIIVTRFELDHEHREPILHVLNFITNTKIQSLNIKI